MFISFEGPEGSGKTTCINAVAERLRAEGCDVVQTREPGAGKVGAEIRQILLHGEDLDFKAELLLFLADRAQHVATVIQPALTQNKIVLCDRFADSTVVYQGYGRGLDLGQLREWNRFAAGGVWPSITFLLDIDPKASLERLTSKDRLDAEPLAFHERVHKGFLAEAKREPHRWRVIDAARSREEIADEVYGHVQEAIKGHAKSAHAMSESVQRA